MLERRDVFMSVDELKMPKFASEREEADWWVANPDFALKVLERAKAEGTLGHGSAARRVSATEAAKGVPVALDPADIALASKLAERKGVERETYLKELVHAALLKEAESLDKSSAA
jgi:hypothetical protein